MYCKRHALCRFYPILNLLLVVGCRPAGDERLDGIRIHIAERRQASAGSIAGISRPVPGARRVDAPAPEHSLMPSQDGSKAAAAHTRLDQPAARNSEPAGSFRLASWRQSHDPDLDVRPGPLPGFLETLQRDLKGMPADLWKDIKAVYGSPGNLAILGLTYGGSLALQASHVDDSIEDSMVGDNVFSDDVNLSFSVLGNPGLHLGLAGLWYLVGQQTGHDRTYEVGKTLFSALIINGVSAMVGQFATWDRAPNGEYFTFPSGHTSSTFTLASVLHRAYGPAVGIPLYGLGVLVAVERLDDDEHYFSDVVMGSVMGLVIGHTVAGKRDLELYGGRIMPFTDPTTGSMGLAWHRRF